MSQLFTWRGTAANRENSTQRSIALGRVAARKTVPFARRPPGSVDQGRPHVRSRWHADWAGLCFGMRKGSSRRPSRRRVQRLGTVTIMLAIACDTPDADPTPAGGPRPAGSADAASTQTAEVLPSGEDAGPGACPAAGQNLLWTCNTALSYWARNPLTRSCCFYAALCEVPPGWAAFSTEEECRTDCRCEQIEPFREDPFSVGIARESLECSCARSDRCATTFEQDSERWCAERGTVLLARGCGRLELSTGPDLTGGAAVYEASSGRLIGLLSFSDVLSRPCLTSVTISGAELDCVGATQCVLCGDGPPDVPRCD